MRAALLCLPLLALSAPAQERWLPLDELPRARAQVDPRGRLLELGQRLAGALPAPLRGLSVPTRGELRLAVVLVELADQPRPAGFADPAHWERALFSRGYARTATGEPAFGSLAEWYAENSGGALQVGGRAFDWVRIPGTRAGLAARPMFLGQRALFGAALDALLRREGPRALDGFHALAFVVAGEMHGLERGSVLWPHSAALLHRGRPWRYYVMTSELTRFAPIGVHCHELGHVLGILDKYGLDQGGGLGQWCAMAQGAHGAQERGVPLEAPTVSAGQAARGFLQGQVREVLERLRGLTRPGGQAPRARPSSGEARPLHLCAVCKLRLGWSRPVTIDPRRGPVRLELRAIEEDPGQVVRVPLDPCGREALVLEYRRPVGFDAELPREGLLVWRTGSPLALLRTFVPLERVELLAAHGLRSLDAALRDPRFVPFPAAERAELTARGERPGAWAVTLRGIAIEGQRLRVEVSRAE